MDVRYHPLFDRWLGTLATGDEEVFGDVMALMIALETYGRSLDDERREESHPVVSSRFDLHALRRTPPSQSTPYASDPPVLRILYGYCRDANGAEVASIPNSRRSSSEAIDEQTHHSHRQDCRQVCSS